MNRSPQPSGRPSARPVVGVVAPAALLAAGGFALGLALGEPRTVEAQITASQDLDNDGLIDEIELILGTDPFTNDTDQDGYGDLEEVARHSNPLITSSIPEAEPVAVAMVGRASAGTLEIVLPLYLEQGNLAGLDFSIGMRLGQSVFEIDPAVWLPMATYSVHPGAIPGDAVIVLKLQIFESFVTGVGNLSFYATATPAGAAGPVTAGVLNLVSMSPVTVQVIGLEDTGSEFSSAYRPLNDAPEIPASWSPGELCSRTTEPVGLVGSVVIQEVTDARCDTADGYCIPTCADSIGEQEELLDPLALLGG